jgi:hypothetical protein
MLSSVMRVCSSIPSTYLAVAHADLPGEEERVAGAHGGRKRIRQTAWVDLSRHRSMSSNIGEITGLLALRMAPVVATH